MSRLLRWNGWTPVSPAGWRELEPSPPPAPPAGRDAREARERLLRHLAELRRRAFREGYEAGFRQGMEAAERRLRGALGAVRRLLLRALEERAREDAQILEALVELAAAVAERVVRDALRDNPERLAELVREAARSLGEGVEEVEVRVHPRDAAVISAAVGPGAGLRVRWRVVEDPSLEPGDAMLYSRRGRIDLRVRQQVRRLLEGVGDDG